MREGDRSNRSLPRRLALGGWGWILVLAVLLTLLAAVWQIRMLGGAGARRQSAAFDLSTCLVARELLTPAGTGKGGIPALVDPPHVPGSAVAEPNAARRGKFLVPGDLVVGIELGGRARAYPLHVLAWHEAVNDVLGGVPLLVSYSPLSGAVVAARRTVEGDVLELRVSGLLLASNTVLYDRRENPQDESLWCQLTARAIAGPAAAAGRELPLLPLELTTWARWFQAHPETEVITGLERFRRRYDRRPYASYLASDILRFPVSPLPEESTRRLKAPGLILGSNRAAAWLGYAEIAARQGVDQGWSILFGHRRLRLLHHRRPETVEVAEEGDAAAEGTGGGRGQRLPVRHAFWFVWYALSRTSGVGLQPPPDGEPVPSQAEIPPRR